jgi:hypothetical protein
MELQDIINSSVTGSGGNRVGDLIELGKATIDLHETIDVASSDGGVHGMHLKGRGRATRFRWLGPDDRPVFRFTDGNGCELSDVMIEVVEPAQELVKMCDSNDGTVRSSHNILRNIYVPDASYKLGIFWHIGGGEDNKNDFMRGYNLDVTGCETGVLIEGRNSLNHELYGCVFKGRAGGDTAIRTAAGGSVRMFGGGVIQFSESAFDIDTRNGVALVASGVHVEQCGRLIRAPEPDPSEINTHTAILDGIRWGSAATVIPPSGEIIDYSGGTLIVRGCWFGTRTPKETVYRFKYTTTQSIGDLPIGDFIFEDCRVRAVNDTGHWPGLAPNSVRGSLLYAGTSPQPVPMPVA